MILTGTDVVDLQHASILTHADVFTGGEDDWMSRHLTDRERAMVLKIRHPVERGFVFWKIFALKEASSKAVSQAGRLVPQGSFTHFECDLANSSVEHCSGLNFRVCHLNADAFHVHAVVVSPPSDDSIPRVHWEVATIEGKIEASIAVREQVHRSLQKHGYQGFVCGEDNGSPVLSNGRIKLSLSLSHSGRYGAFSWVAP